MSRQRPTLLVFTRGPGREGGHRRWLRGPFGALERALHERCLAEVLAAGRAAGCALRVSTPDGRRLAADATADRQDESAFGARLLGAIERAEDLARGPLVVVGTDTPGVGRRTLRRALAALRRDPRAVAIGPSADGGVYLLAAALPIARELAGVRWRRATTFTSIVTALRAAGRPVRLLPTLCDLDSRRDLERWLSTGSRSAEWRGVVAALRAALASLARPPAPAVVPVLAAAWRDVPVGRAPPC